MDSDFEKLLQLKDQHLKHLLHPREEAHKLNQQKKTIFDDQQDSS